MSSNNYEQLSGDLSALFCAHLSLIHLMHESGVLNRRRYMYCVEGLVKNFEGKPGHGALLALLDGLTDDDPILGHPEWLRGVIDGGKDGS